MWGTTDCCRSSIAPQNDRDWLACLGTASFTYCTQGRPRAILLYTCTGHAVHNYYTQCKLIHMHELQHHVCLWLVWNNICIQWVVQGSSICISARYVTCDWTGVASAKNEGRALAVVVAMALFKMYEGFEGWARELGGRDLNWSQKYPLGWGGGAYNYLRVRSIRFPGSTQIWPSPVRMISFDVKAVWARVRPKFMT